MVIFGTGVAPVIASFVYDVTQSYNPVLRATIPLCLFASPLFFALGSYPDFDEAPFDTLDKAAPAHWRSHLTRNTRSVRE
ncbi:MAG: hypothetical protein KDE55_03560 [Novosphingobium sp.]|nr:hypothetical protein [Novosphingobium sp.]